ncbi:MAG: hypothetical protein ACFE0P_09380 [Oceanicaulis sp.]
MTRRRSRHIAAKERRRRTEDGPDPAAMMRLAGLGAMLLLFVAVGAGFQGERVTSALAGLAARLGPLADPVLLGRSAIEIAGGIAVFAVLAAGLWRAFRR